MWQDRAYASPEDGHWFTRSRGTWTIVGITVAAHVAKLVANLVHPGARNWVDAHLGTSWQGFADGELWRVVTYQLVHGDTRHILFNMVTLGFAGWMLEPQFGTRPFVRLYVASGLVGSLSPILRHAFYGEVIPTIGASGAIFGVMVALALLMPNVMILFFMLIPMKIKYAVAIFVGIELLEVLGREGAGTDSFCHLLGAATGLWVAYLWPRFMAPRWEEHREKRAEVKRQQMVEQVLDEERELDRLLEKIAKDGMPALTEKEREFLKRVSGKYQNAKRD